MNYKKHYDLLIYRSLNRNIDTYTEKHHIIPRCLGGTDDEINLVSLTPEEHYIAHQLLVKIYPNNKSLIKAAVMMIPNRPSNKLYGWLRRKFSNAMAESQSGKGNTQYGTKWIFNLNLRVCKKIKKDQKIPEGWEIGRIMNFDDYLNKIHRCEEKNTQRIIEQTKRYIKEKELMAPLYERYKNGESLRSIAKGCEYSHVALHKRFKKIYG